MHPFVSYQFPHKTSIEYTIKPNKTAPRKVRGPVSSCLFIICLISLKVTIYNRNPLKIAPKAMNNFLSP
jgi:hypothetical protein